jgi:hypothetical protein
LAGEEDGSDNDNDDESADENEINGMIPPPDVLAENQVHYDDVGSSSSDMEDMEDEENDSDNDSGFDGPPVPSSSAACQDKETEDMVDTEGAASLEVKQGHPKAFHMSPEWMELRELELQNSCYLTRLPPVVGCTVNRHPSKNFWSTRYPNQGSKSSSWNEFTSRRTSLVRCIRHVIKLHLAEHPDLADAESFKKQLEDLKKLE